MIKKLKYFFNDLNHNDSGSALVIVVLSIMLMMLLIGTIVTMSQTQRFAAAGLDKIRLSVYDAESALNRTIWLLEDDISKNNDRKNVENELSEKEIRFQANGRSNVFVHENMAMEVKIYDAVSGVQLNGTEIAEFLNFLTQRYEKMSIPREQKDQLAAFIEKLTDYIDSDNIASRNGLEKYPQFAMPRNSQLEQREEIYYLKNAKKIFPPDNWGRLAYFNAILPPEYKIPTETKIQFFSAPIELICDIMDFDEDEKNIVMEAVKNFRKKNISLEEAFGRNSQLLLRLRENFSFGESGFYRIEVAPLDNLYANRRIEAIIRINSDGGINSVNIVSWQLF